MTNPDETSPVTPLDPSDPRWVEDILARARQRAEESQAAKSAAPTDGEPAMRAPVESTAPPQAEPPPAVQTPVESTAPPQVEPPPAVRSTGEPPPAVQTPKESKTIPPIVDQPPTAAIARGAKERPTIDVVEPTSEAPRRSPRPQPRVDTPEKSIPSELGDSDTLTKTTAASKSPAPLDDDGDDDDKPQADHQIRNWIEWGGVIVGALLVAFLIRAVFFQAFYIPSESMESTLNIGDRILVNKLSYKFHDVNRGDLIVFAKPAGETSALDDLIKRVIALPGESIEQRGSDLYIDRGEGPQLLTESYINEPNNIGPTITWVQGCANPATETDRCTIPEGHLWVMGDNRGHSRDSRFFGPVDEDLIVGRAFVKVWPFTKIGFL